MSWKSRRGSEPSLEKVKDAVYDSMIEAVERGNIESEGDVDTVAWETASMFVEHKMSDSEVMELVGEDSELRNKEVAGILKDQAKAVLQMELSNYGRSVGSRELEARQLEREKSEKVS